MTVGWTDAALWAVGLSGGILALRMAATGLLATIRGFAWLICRCNALYARLTAQSRTLGTDMPPRGVRP